MQLYGDVLVRIKGKICASDDLFFQIHFVEYDKISYVPKYLIKYQIKPNSTDVQDIRIPLWFLKKNRVLPLF